MEMVWILAALIALVLCAVVWVIWRTRSDASVEPAPPPAATAPRRALRPTWGKAIVVPDRAKACQAVLQLDGHEFPNADAPRLPLPSCTVSNCKCYYVPARERRLRTERRSGIDRRSGLRYEPGQPGDRRSGKDRRHGDNYDWDHTI
jgi:hypothetical protein